MRNLAALLAMIALVAGITWALPARCDDCHFSGSSCYGDAICGQGCSCILINGPGKAGVCQ